MPALRWRTANHAGNVPGQPERPLTDPLRVPHRGLARHTCGWCGGPRSHSNATTRRSRVLCHQCMRAEFPEGYDQFVRTERARTREREKKQKQQRLTPVK